MQLVACSATASYRLREELTRLLPAEEHEEELLARAADPST